MTGSNEVDRGLGVSGDVFLNNPIIREAMKKTLLARPAQEDDDTADVLVLGRDFSYIVLGKDDNLAKTNLSGGPLNAPERVIIDADSFLSGLHAQFGDEHTVPRLGIDLIGIRESDGSLFRVDPNG